MRVEKYSNFLVINSSAARPNGDFYIEAANGNERRQNSCLVTDHLIDQHRLNLSNQSIANDFIAIAVAVGNAINVFWRKVR